MKTIAIAAFLLMFTILPASAQWIEEPGIDAIIQQGIRATYNMEFDNADRAFRAVMEKRPDHPAGYFFDAMIDWWRILIDIENESADDAFFDKLERVIEICDKRLASDEDDLTALFFKGGAIGFRGRLRATRRSWLKTAADGKEALPIVLAAGQAAPQNADINLGAGIYNYYAAVLPEKYPVLKPLMLFLPEGNRGRGLRQLKTAAENARYANWEAMYFLLQVYAGYENRPSQALPYARRLHDEFPKNPVFHRYLGRVYVKLGNWNDAGKIFSEILTRIEQGMIGYTQYTEREAAYYVGYEAMLRRDFASAMKFFVRCDELSRSLDNDGPSGFMVMTNLRMGMVHDLLNQRKYAMKQYDKVLSMREYSGSHSVAEKYKRQPYSY